MNTKKLNKDLNNNEYILKKDFMSKNKKLVDLEEELENLQSDKKNKIVIVDDELEVVPKKEIKSKSKKIKDKSEDASDNDKKSQKKNEKYNLVDMCAGTGAFSLAFENTKKVETVFANDFEKNSKIIFDENFDLELTLKDIHDIDVKKEIPKFDILTSGFPCFITGTKVLTNNGYKNIEDVKLSDKLLTHTGKHQNILNLQEKEFTGTLYDIKIIHHGEKIICTEEHPFYIRNKNKRWNNDLRKYDYFYDEPKWIKASEVKKNNYFGMVINDKKIIPEFTFNKKISKANNEEIKIKLDKPEYWYLMGYFVGDGWIEETTKQDGRSANKIRFAINNKDEDEVFNIINTVIPITDKKCDSGSNGKCKKFGCNDYVWFNILKEFGKYAHGKKIPEWVHNAPSNLIEQFILGYNKADGCVCNDIIQITTVSHDLAHSLQRLYLKLGHIFSINKCVRPKTTIIEGRKVNQRDTYCVRGKLNKTNGSGFIENGYAWFPLSKVNKTIVNEKIKVYNFEVEEDNSYIVENTIVHNCQPFSIAGEQKGFEDERSNVFFKLIEIIKIHKPRIVIFENVKNLKSHDEGRTFKKITDEITKLKYFYKCKILNTCEISNIPQNRERIYIVCFLKKEDHDKFEFPLEIDEDNRLDINDILEKNVDNSFYYTNKLKIWEEIEKNITKNVDTNTVYQYRRYYVRENKNGVCPTLTANMGGGGHNVPLIKDNKGIRKLTPRECFNLQGFPQNYVLSKKISNSGLYKLAGNAVSYVVVEKIAKNIILILEN